MREIQQQKRQISVGYDGCQWPCKTAEKFFSLPSPARKEVSRKLALFWHHSNGSHRPCDTIAIIDDYCQKFWSCDKASQLQKNRLHSNKSGPDSKISTEKKLQKEAPKNPPSKKRVHVGSLATYHQKRIPVGAGMREQVSPPRKQRCPSELEVGLQHITTPKTSPSSSPMSARSASKGKEKSASAPKRSPTRVIRGLKNLGNTCYMNAVLQILFSLDGFHVELKKACFPCSSASPLCSWSILYALGHVLKQLECPTSRGPVNPHLLKKAFVTNQSRFGGYTQEDAHEFLCYLLQQVHEEVTSPAKDTEEMSTKNGDKNICFVGKYFSCNLMNTVSCVNCGKSSSNQEEYRHFSLGIPQDKKGPHDLKSLLMSTYFNDTSLSRTCDRCGATDFTCRSRFSTFPKVLVLHIKRVQGYLHAGSTKSSLPIKFTEQLDIGEWYQFVSQEQPQQEQDQPIPQNKKILADYKLHGIISHLGHEGSSGHFVADVFHENGNCWMRCDDARVTKLSPEHVFHASKEKEGYMFVYVKQPTPGHRS